MKTYKGRREGHAALVTVNRHPLNPRLDLWNHSPSGFEWGYGGSGPAQLALALLADHLGNDDEALKLYHDFKRTVANLPSHGWTLTSEQIQNAVAALKAPFLAETVLSSNAGPETNPQPH
jgi:hypothetical protein